MLTGYHSRKGLPGGFLWHIRDPTRSKSCERGSQFEPEPAEPYWLLEAFSVFPSRAVVGGCSQAQVLAGQVA